MVWKSSILNEWLSLIKNSLLINNLMHKTLIVKGFQVVLENKSQSPALSGES
jgi:hypothetical protein